MQEVQELEDRSHLPGYTIKNWSSQQQSSEEPNRHVKATRLFELASVSITRDTFKELDAELRCPHVENPRLTFYGYIRLTDDLGNEFYLFNRYRDDPKTVFLHNPLSVILPKYELNSPRCLSKTFFLEFYLVDWGRKTVILDEWRFFDCACADVVYDKEQTVSCGPPHNVYVNYTMFQCALVAHVGVSFDKTDEDGIDVCAEVTGIISSAISKVNCSDRVLFDDTRKVGFGGLFKLSTVAVPAYSSLEIQANLKVNGEQIVGALEFEPLDYTVCLFEKEIVGQKCRIRVFVAWRHAVDCLPEYDSHEWRAAEGASSEEIEDCFSQTEESSDKRNRICKAPQITRSRRRKQRRNEFRAVNIKSRKLLDLSKRDGISRSLEVLVEVFSISFCSDGVGGCVVKPRGRILLYDCYLKYVIFDGEKQRLDMLHPGELVPLVEPPSCYGGDHFGIELKLEDGDGREICNGYLAYGGQTADHWLNRRICSIVRGEHGFAAVHYMALGDAIQAKLKFSIQSDTTVCCQVKGRINARYGSCRYSTHYEKKHYQSILFRKSEFVDLEDGDEIPLSKTAVAATLRGPLIVIADLRVLTKGSGYVETLKCKSAFNPEILSHTIHGSNYRLLVSVEWG